MAPKVKKRVTKDMIDILAQYELRALCVHLGMPLLAAWRASPDERGKWLVEHMDDFVTAELSGMDWTVYRPPAKDYLYALQAYAGGNGVLPVLNPLMDAPAVVPVAYVEPDVWARTDEEIAEDEDEEIAAVTSGKEEDMARFQKASLGGAPVVAEPVKEAVEVAPVVAAKETAATLPPRPVAISSAGKGADTDQKIDTLLTLCDGIAQVLTRLHKDIAELRSEVKAQAEALTTFSERAEAAGAWSDNALLFVINSAFISEGEETVKSLEEIPDQSAPLEDDVPM